MLNSLEVNMKRRDYTRIIIYVLLIIFFNFLFFLSKKVDKNDTSWLAYIFTHIALLVSCGAPFICINYKRIPENLVTIFGFAWLYAIIACAINSLYIFMRVNHFKSCLVLNLALLLVYLIQLIINVNVNYTVEKNIETIEAERQFVSDTTKKIKMMMQLAGTEEIRRKIERAYDAVRTCPLHSNSQVMNYEVEIIRLVDVLEEKIDKGSVSEIDDIVLCIEKNVKKRNSML